MLLSVLRLNDVVGVDIVRREALCCNRSTSAKAVFFIASRAPKE